MSGSAVDCERVEAALSARHDGDDPGLSASVVESHLDGCARCRAFDASLGHAVASVRPLRPVGTPPAAIGSAASGDDRDPARDASLADRVTAVAAAEDRAGVWWVLRGLLALVAVGYLATAVPELLFASDPHHAHLARHLGAFEAAYAVGLLFVAARPAKARAMVPLTVALAVVMGVVMLVDLLAGRAFLLNETSHVLEVAGLVLVWLLATRRGWPGRRDSRVGGPSRGSPPSDDAAPPRRPTLVVATDDERPHPVGRRAG
jgi:predicted anti-sigma-YlaC factor YlaD